MPGVLYRTDTNEVIGITTKDVDVVWPDPSSDNANYATLDYDISEIDLATPQCVDEGALRDATEEEIATFIGS